VPNIANIDLNKSLFEIPRFREQHLGARFFFKPEEDLNITLDLVTSQLQNKNR